MMNLYGNGAHMVAYQINESTISWAYVKCHRHCISMLSDIKGLSITLREPEAKETWKPMEGDAVEEFKSTSPFRHAKFGGEELIRDVNHLIKVWSSAVLLSVVL